MILEINEVKSVRLLLVMRSTETLQQADDIITCQKQALLGFGGCDFPEKRSCVTRSMKSEKIGDVTAVCL